MIPVISAAYEVNLEQIHTLTTNKAQTFRLKGGIDIYFMPRTVPNPQITLIHPK
jgi:hypothetical protein